MTGQRMRGLARHVRGRLSSSDGGLTGAPTPAASPNVERILRSGLVDRTYYELQTGQSFASDADVVRHFLQQGHRTGTSIHPLFEPEWFRRERPRNRPNSVLAYLDEGGGEHGPGPLFGEARHLEQHPEADRHPGRALGHFVAHAADDDPLPAPSGHRATALTWGQARQLAYDAARDFRRDEDLRSTPRRGPWDERADARFVAERVGRRQAPTTGGPPVVSVVMPVRNRPRQVLDAIASVQQQTMTDWELLVVDDGSTDDTPEVIARVAAEDPRVRLVRRAWSGVSAARNAGIAEASGGWLAFLDSDNTWVPHFLEVMVGELESRDLGAGHAVIDTLVEPVEEGSGRYLAFDGGLEHLLVRNHIDLNGLMVQTALAREVGGFDESLRRWVDHDLVIQIAGVRRIPLVPFVGVRYDHELESTDRITTTEADFWEWIVLGKHYVDWDDVRARASDRRADVVSVCMPSLEDWAYTKVAIDAVLDEADRTATESALELVLLVNGARRCVGTILHAMYDGDPRVRILSVPRNLNFGLSANYAFAASTGGTVVFLDNDTEVLPGWLPPLVDALSDPEVLGCQALLLQRDGSVQHAGWGFTGRATLPFPLLADLPVEEVQRLEPLEVRAVAASALAMRAADVIALGGFDISFVNGFEDVDLSLRAVDGGSRRFRVATDSLVVHRRRKPLPRHYDRDQANRRRWLERWGAEPPPSDLGVVERLGHRVAHVDSGEAVEGPRDVRLPRPVVVRLPSTVTSGEASGQPCLRWALKTSMPLRATEPTPDHELAGALADALRRLGQDVVTDRLETHQRRSGYLDDVAIGLRGADVLAEEPGRINIAWIVGSDVTLEEVEVRRYDAVLSVGPDGPVLRPAAAWAAEGDLAGTSVRIPTDADLGAAAALLLSRAVELRRTRATP
jgi:O-antigen biosynthesis protein